MRTIRMLAALVVAGAVMVVPMASPAAAGGGCHVVLGGGPLTEASGSTVELQGVCMVPTVLHVAPGTDVSFVNPPEGAGHNLYGAGLAVSELDAGDTVSARFDQPGTFPYACMLHPGMVGAIVVGDDAGATMQPVAATRPLVDGEPPFDATPLVVLVSVALTLVVGGLGYGLGRRSAELGADDRADG